MAFWLVYATALGRGPKPLVCLETLTTRGYVLIMHKQAQAHRAGLSTKGQSFSGLKISL